MNNHVTSLKLSKKLKEAGVEQISEFEWVKHSLNKKPVLFTKPVGDEIIAVLSGKVEYRYSAFLTDELLEKLPPIFYGQGVLNINRVNAGDEWEIAYYDFYRRKSSEDFPNILNKSLPEAAGEMLLWVIENGYAHNK